MCFCWPRAGGENCVAVALLLLLSSSLVFLVFGGESFLLRKHLSLLRKILFRRYKGEEQQYCRLTMASNRTGDGSKAVRFSETEATGVDDEKGKGGGGGGGKREGQERYEPLPVMGGIKEKGFSTASVSSAPVSLPNPSVTAFPVARHRSQGPVKLLLHLYVFL